MEAFTNLLEQLGSKLFWLTITLRVNVHVLLVQCMYYRLTLVLNLLFRGSS